MITKAEIISKISDLASGGDSEPDYRSRYHPSDIEAICDEVYTNLIRSTYNPENDEELDVFGKPFLNVPVLFDEARNEFYSDLPCQVVQIPENSGIRLISPMQDQTVQICPIDNNGQFIFSKLESQMFSGVPTYYYEKSGTGSGYKLFYDFRGENYPKLLMKLVSTFESLKYDDEVYEPSLLTKRGLLTMTDIVLQRLRQQPTESMSNDNNPNP